MRVKHNPAIEKKISDAMHKYLLQCGAFVEDEAKRNTPVDTGLARSSIHVVDHISSEGKVLVGADEDSFKQDAMSEYARLAQLKRPGKKRLSHAANVATGSVVFYFKFLEFGTRYMAPRAMLRNALDKLIVKAKGKHKK